MPVTYIEKGIGLWVAIKQAGFQLLGKDGVYITNPNNPADTTNDAAVQAIINSYDPLPYYKQQAIIGVKATALQKMQTLFPALTDIDTVNLVAELWKSIAAAAHSPTANMTTVINIYTAAANGIAAVNAASTTQAVDAVVSSIVWPV